MCGVVGIIGSKDAAREALLALTTLQHRGQDAAGILTYDEFGFHSVKGLGLVDTVFSKENTQVLTGSVALGHTRYSTAGRGTLAEVQPLVISYPYGIAVVHNGNLINTAQLTHELKTQSKRRMMSSSDTEVILNLLAEGLSLPTVQSSESDVEFSIPGLERAVRSIMDRVNGSYSIVSLIGDHGLLAFRDPLGIRPLIYGTKTNPDGSLSHGVASESVALEFNGYGSFRDLAPGEMLWISQGNVISRILKNQGKRHCFFEWVYFASPESEIDQKPVYGARIELGRNLAAQVKALMQSGDISPDVVIPIPDSARIAAISLAEEIGIPYRELLIKNRYVKRTFIMDTQDRRKKAVNLKLSPVRSEIEGKSVLLVDDSIVRGTTSQKIIELVRDAGARNVYFVSTCPPIRKPCYYGIDFPDEKELIAAGRTEKDLAQELGADAVVYQTNEGLAQAILQSRPESQSFQPCMACLTGTYPTDISQASELSKNRTRDRGPL